MEKEILKSRAFVTELFNSIHQPFLKYHNLHHTERVVERALEIGKQSGLSEPEFSSLIIAAWFHDIGHLFNELENHEQVSAQLMTAFLKSSAINEIIIHETAMCILATKMPVSPTTTIQKVLCDADTYHFGTKEFFETDPKIYEEIESRLNIPIKHQTEKSIRLLESHHFYTEYCQRLLNAGKQDNINELKKTLR